MHVAVVPFCVVCIYFSLSFSFASAKGTANANLDLLASRSRISHPRADSNLFVGLGFRECYHRAARHNNVDELITFFFVFLCFFFREDAS